MLIALTSLTVFATAFFFAAWLLVKEDRVRVRLDGLRGNGGGGHALPDPGASFSARVLAPAFGGLTDKINRVLPASMVEQVRLDLIAGGLQIKPPQYFGIYAMFLVGAPLLLTFMAASSGMGGQSILAFIFGIGIGFVGPRFWLKRRIKNRQAAILKSLPDSFDLITASVEAGLGIDAALSKVVSKVKGPFADELGKTIREMSMGRLRREALTDLAQRTRVDALDQFVNALIQAEQMGVSIGHVMRVQSDLLRTKRRQKAEESAMKAPVKMVFPLVFFIFPAIFMVILGPTMLNMGDFFGG
jgi:tight adherence protein C